MPTCSLGIEFGHPDFWKSVYERFPRFFEVHPRLKTSFNSISAKPRVVRERDHKVILNLCQMAGVAMEELVTLAGNGLGIGAMKIARNLLELSINAEYLRSHSSAVDDFVEWFWVEEYQWVCYAERHDPVLLARLDAKKIAKTKHEFTRVRARFEKANGKIRSGWCVEPLSDRATKTGLELGYRVVNPFGSQFLHGTPGALLNHFDLAMGDQQISVPPSLKWCSQALCGAITVLLW